MYATSINPVSAAAHHVMLSVFLFFATMGDSVSQAAQSFLPAVVGLPACVCVCVHACVRVCVCVHALVPTPAVASA